jgi:uncharacterized protein (TIRG00374 family)
MTANGKGRGIPTWIPATILAVLLLYFALRGVEWRRVGEIIAGANWALLSTFLGTCTVAAFLRSLRWRLLLNSSPNSPQTRLGVVTVFWATMAGYLGNLVLPARAGELVRTFLVSARSGLSKTFVLTTALGERVMDAIALILFSSVALLGVDSKPAWMQGLARSLAAVAVASALGVALLPYIQGLIEDVLRKLPLPTGLRERLVGLIEQVILGLRAFHDVRRFATFAGLTLVIWSTDTCGAIVVARSLGLHLSFRVALLFLSGLGLSSALPSTPGYVGIYQFVAVTVLGPFGIGRDQALAFIFVAQALGAIVVVGFGVPGVIRLGGSLSAFGRVVREKQGTGNQEPRPQGQG